MITIGQSLRARLSLSAIRTLRAALVTVTGSFALAGCMRDALGVDALNAALNPTESAVAARIKLNTSQTQLDVLGSYALFLTWAFDGSGAVLCVAHWVGCAPQLFTKRIEWKTDRPDIIALEVGDGVILNARANFTALAPGRVEVTASVDGIKATTVVEVVERARVTWSLRTQSAATGIAIGEDGTIYTVGSATGLQAVGPGGELRWTVAADARALPAIAGDGTIYLGGGQSLMAINSDGTVRWVTPTRGGGMTNSAPAIGPDGTIYQNTNQGTLHAVDPNGRIKWTFEAPGPLNRNPSPPAIAEDGTIYFASEDGHLYAFYPDGRERWRFTTGGPVRAASIGLDGTIYFANDLILSSRNSVLGGASRMYALNPDGTERWSAALEGEVWAGPAIGFDGTLYMGTYNNGGATFLFSPEGSLLRKVNSWAIHTPIVAGDGSIYYSGGAVAAFDGKGTPRWRFQPENFAGPAPAIGFDGRIYAGASDDDFVNTLYAFDEMSVNNGGYQKAPWPQERGDRANTGRALRRP